MASVSSDNNFSEQLAASQQEVRDRMDKYVAAWNTGDMDTILSYFVDEGLDYSDYGRSPFIFLALFPPHPCSSLSNFTNPSQA
jgi:hypothetical protein